MCLINTIFSNTLIVKKISKSISLIPRKISFLLFFISFSAFGELQLNGVSTYVEHSEEQFIAGLYATNYSKSSHDMLGAHNEKKIEIKILHDQLSVRRFKRMWIEGMAINLRTTELEKHAENMANFSNMLNINLNVNDIISVQELPDSLLVSINGITLGRLPDPLFIDQLLRVFIGDVPLSTKFKEGFLAGGDAAPQLISRFIGIYPTHDRIEAIRYSMNEKSETIPSATDVAVNDAAPVVAAPKITVPKPKITDKPAINNKPKPVVAANVTKPVVKKVVEKVVKAPPSIVSVPPTVNTNTKKTKPKLVAKKESIIDDTDIKFTADDILKEQMYYLSLTRYTQKFVRYPKVSMARRHEGSLLIRTTIDSEGNVLNTEIIEKTAHKALNQEGLKAIKRANPYPAIPEGITGNEFSFSVVITFGLDNK